MNAASSWVIESTTGAYKQANHVLTFDSALPRQGLSYQRGDWEQQNVLSVDLPGEQSRETPLDCYVRVDDCVVSYPQDSTRTVAPQFYWRVLADDADFVVQLILSMQTNLLVNQPTTTVGSRLAPGEVLQHDGKCWMADASEDSALGFLHRPADQSDLSFFQVIHPTDRVRSILNSQLASFELFEHSLEKGVIRRARIVAGWTSRSGDEETAERYLQQLIAEAPPLTT